MEQSPGPDTATNRATPAGGVLRSTPRRALMGISLAGLLLALTGVGVIAALNHPVAAVKALALILLTAAGARLVFRQRWVWFATRAWWVDAIALALLAAALFYLSPYAGVIMPAVPAPL